MGLSREKPQYLAGIDALVREIERRKETNDLAEALPRHLLGAPGKRLQQFRARRGKSSARSRSATAPALPRLARAAGVDAVSERRTNAASGSVLNSVTKLTRGT